MEMVVMVTWLCSGGCKGDGVVVVGCRGGDSSGGESDDGDGLEMMTMVVAGGVGVAVVGCGERNPVGIWPEKIRGVENFRGEESGGWFKAVTGFEMKKKMLGLVAVMDNKKKKESDGDGEMMGARIAFEKAKSKGNKKEEARWANVMGNILVSRGETIPAFAWFSHDHMQKHLVIADETNDLVEQQRACTQLGLTYIQIASSQAGKERKTSRSIAYRYIKRAGKLSQIIKENRQADDDVVSVVCSNEYPSGSKHVSESPEVSSRRTSSRKRSRLVPYDGRQEDKHARGKAHLSIEELKSRDNLTSRHGDKYQDTPPVTSKRSRKKEAATASHFGVNGLKCDADGGQTFYYCDNEYCKHIIFKVGDDYVHIEPDSYELSDNISMDDLKLEVACLYFLKLVKEKRFRGSLPIIGNLKCRDLVLESLDILKDDMLEKSLVDVSIDGSLPIIGNLKCRDLVLESLDILKDDMLEKSLVDVSIDAWVCKRLIKRYVDCCNKLSQPLHAELLMKLYNLQVSEDDIDASECELDEILAAPLYEALSLHTEIASLNLSHNLLGNETMRKLKDLFRPSGSNLNPLALDLHCNSFGPTSLYQRFEREEMDAQAGAKVFKQR
uniref:Uncharacterized protein n=1 Tax=Tanacetum cinerariifolium TaxID=118510 RepID=A0A6L2MU60_TANCI|nr:hypothetical protein [Tanacetum cinerariifolium]